MKKKDAVVIVGSGLMGSGIAARSALAGNQTILVDKKLDYANSGYEKACECIDELGENGLYTKNRCFNAKQLISVTTSVEEACEQAMAVIEAITEKLELKQDLFETLDSVLPEWVPIMSNTSGLRITDIAARTRYPQRTMTAHFWFPAHLVPLVEVVMSDKTDEKLAESVKNMLNRWGKKAVLVKKDLPGQLANRLLQAVIREAINIVEIGLASPEDVDTAVKMGMGIRMPVWGPLEHIEAVGLDLGLSVQQTVLPEISSSKEVSPYLEKLVKEGHLGQKTNQGFYDWNVKDKEQLAKTRNDFIINALSFMEERKL